MAATDARTLEMEPRIVGHANDVHVADDAPPGDRSLACAEALEEEVAYEDQEEIMGDDVKWSFAMGILAGLDLFFSAAFCGVAFKYAFFDNGASLYCTGCQMLSHWFSSLLLILRAAAELCPRRQNEREVSLLQKRRVQLQTEQGISIVMGLTMLIGAASLAFKAFLKMRFWNAWYLDHHAMDEEIATTSRWLAWTGFCIYFLQAVLRAKAARVIRIALYSHACVASAVSCVFLLSLGVAASFEGEVSL